MFNLSAIDIAKNIREKKVSCREVCEQFLGRAQTTNSAFNAFISFNENLLDEAKTIDQRIAFGESIGPLCGVPIAVKDIFCTKGLKTTAASKMLADFIPPYTATCVSLLERAGALILGKTNLDEFAMGSSNELSFFGPTLNPWDKTRVPGGSSGGSAAAVAIGAAPAALGTDTGGSIRLPAHFCGLVGAKPTYGRISRYGVIAHASSLDQAGPMTRTVSDAALLTYLMAGKDRLDSTTSTLDPENWSEMQIESLAGKKVGVISEFEGLFLHADVQAALQETVEILENAGAEVVRVSIPELKYAVPVYYLVSMSEASSNLSRYDGIRYGHRSSGSHMELEEFYSTARAEGFGAEVKRRILVGTHALSSGYYDAYYLHAAKIRRLISESFQKHLSECVALVCPVSTEPAFKLGSKATDPVAMYKNDMMTTAASLAGLPALSVPVRLSQEKLPVGIQILARSYDEQTMFNVGKILEQSRSHKEFVAHGLG